MRMPSAVFATFALVVAAGAARASSHIVELRWDAGGSFSHSATVAAGKFVEVCGRLDKGASVRWSFEAAVPVDFNIHHHVGKDVVYSAKQTQVSRGEDRLAVQASEDYCWMWTNKGAAAAQLRVQLSR